MLASEEGLHPIPDPGQPAAPRPSREDTIALPKCTTEGIAYVMECWTCRLAGKSYRYIGETSRSGHQRGTEHWKEIVAGKKTHPMVEHFSDHHEGQQQEVLYRIVAQFQKALERQVWESVEIDSTISTLGLNNCLNSKTEWGMSKDPALISKTSPAKMGIARAQKEGQTHGNTSKRIRVFPQEE